MGIGTGFEEEGAANHLCVLQKVGVCFLFKTARRFTSARNANQVCTERYSKSKNQAKQAVCAHPDCFDCY
jgi:hypothetical protein